MPSIKTQIRQGAYYDSVVLMQLQKSLIALSGVLDAGVVMATDANKELLQQNRLLSSEANGARPEDLLIAVSALDDAAAQSALAQVDELLRAERGGMDAAYRPKSLDSAMQMLPDARWVLVSVPGRYAAGVARDALELGMHVFLYSDNVPIEEEIALKQSARDKGLLVMGPDCGTAIVNGMGLGFANGVKRGRIGLIGASGTGLQAVTVGIQRLGEGVSQAIGTGTNDLKQAVGATTTLQAIDWLGRDAATEVIVLVSKPPAPDVAARVLDAARRSGKPVVVDFIGYSSDSSGNVHFVHTLDDAADLAVALLERGNAETPGEKRGNVMLSEAKHLVGSLKDANQSKKPSLVSVSQDSLSSAPVLPSVPASGYLRGLYSGGTLAYEAQLILRDYLPALYSNAPLTTNHQLPSPHVSQEHTIVDLGAEDFMVGRLHPMIDNDLRIRRIKQEAGDASVTVILFDVMLGYGSHPDPASELAPAIANARGRSASSGRTLEFAAAVIGTEQDPQNLASQIERLQAAGVRVFERHDEAVRYVGEMLGARGHAATQRHEVAFSASPSLTVSVSPPHRVSISGAFAAINVGIESFYESLQAQNAAVVQVDWKPPAGGNEKLIAILEKLKAKS